MQLIDGIPIFGAPIDDGALNQIKVCAQTADHVALMADHHKGYSVPIGGVVAIAADRRQALTLRAALHEDPPVGGGDEAIERTDRAKRVAKSEQLVELVDEGAAFQQLPGC